MPGGGAGYGAATQSLGGLLKGLGDIEARKQQMQLQQEQKDFEKLKSGYRVPELDENKKPTGNYRDLTPEEVLEKQSRQSGLENLETNQKETNLKKTKQEIAEKIYKLSPEGRLKLGDSATQQKLGFIGSGLSALKNYREAYQKGERQGYLTPETPYIGQFKSSTPIDLNRVRMEEAIGRLASGGAINAGEEERFRRMIPTAADSDQIASQKLKDLENEFILKMKLYGANPEDLGSIGISQEQLGLLPRNPEGQQPGLLGGQEKQPAAASQIKMINGQQYQKVQGGWQKVK